MTCGKFQCGMCLCESVRGLHHGIYQFQRSICGNINSECLTIIYINVQNIWVENHVDGLTVKYIKVEVSLLNITLLKLHRGIPHH